MKFLYSLSIVLFITIMMFSPITATEIIDDEQQEEIVEQTDKKSEDLKKSPNNIPAQKKVEETFEEQTVQPFSIIGHTIAPGSRKTLQWFSHQSSLGRYLDIPVIVIHGQKPGPVLGLTAAIHGDELNGIEMIRQVMHELDPKKLKGTIIGVPVVNLEGFYRKERYVGDRRDLNRYFPGNPKGTNPSRIAHAVFSNIIQHCNMVIDIHTGSFYRENLPQLRVDLNIDQVAELATKFGEIAALQSSAPKGSLREAATSAGIPTIVMEIGGPLRLEMDKVKAGVQSLRTFLHSVGMVKKVIFWPTPQTVFYDSQWVRADVGGILKNQAKLGETVQKGDTLAVISNPLTNKSVEVYSPADGTVLGRAQNQFVSPGFALFRVGRKKSVEEIVEEETM